MSAPKKRRPLTKGALRLNGPRGWLNDTRVLASGLLKRIVLPYVVLYDYFISFYLVIFYSIIALYLHYSYIYILYVVYHVNCITLEKYRKILY